MWRGPACLHCQRASCRTSNVLSVDSLACLLHGVAQRADPVCCLTKLLSCTCHREGDGYVLSGHKWWASGAMDPRCAICIFMGKTDPAAPTHKQQSMVLVPMDAGA